MKLKIYVEALREEFYEYDLETTKKIILGKRGMFNCDLYIKPLEITENELEFFAKGNYTIYGGIKFTNEADKQAILPNDGVYKIKIGEKIKFLSDTLISDIKDNSATYYLSIEA